jgi:hypothetical protein
VPVAGCTSTPEFRHKHVRIDQRKLDRARRILEAETETETLDRALGVPDVRRLVVDTNVYVD